VPRVYGVCTRRDSFSFSYIGGVLLLVNKVISRVYGVYIGAVLDIRLGFSGSLNIDYIYYWFFFLVYSIYILYIYYTYLAVEPLAVSGSKGFISIFTSISIIYTKYR